MNFKVESQNIFSICENVAYVFFTEDEDIAISADAYLYDIQAEGPELAFGFSVDLSADETGAQRRDFSSYVVLIPKEHSVAFTKLTVDTNRFYCIGLKVEYKKLAKPEKAIEALEKAMKQQYAASADWLCLTREEASKNKHVSDTLLNWDY